MAAEQARYKSRFLNLHQAGDGMWLLRGQLPALEGHLLKAAFGKIVDGLRVAGDGKTMPQRRADAIMTLATDGGPTATISVTLNAAAAQTGGERTEHVVDVREDPPIGEWLVPLPRAPHDDPAPAWQQTSPAGHCGPPTATASPSPARICGSRAATRHSSQSRSNPCRPPASQGYPDR
ncbi:MAG: DUF222 domain-containing protein [Candidatus Nanopelagicales bacterium]